MPLNLLTDSWLPVIRCDGSQEKIAPWELTGEYNKKPITDLKAPRPDFRNALYQLLIGIVQVAAMPEDEDEWTELWETPYEPEELKEKLMFYRDCFEIDSDGPAFMQDYNLPDGEIKSISALLIEAPGNKTIRDNQDHFVKRNSFNKIDVYWTAIALYTLQTFAPSGGVGHRVGIRGGGPLTTILLPNEKADNSSTLWEKIWLNIFPQEELSSMTGNISKKEKSDIFPWMKQTKTSEKKGSDLFAQECYPLHMYFGMPRRIRLNFKRESGTCDLTGEESSNLLTTFRTKNYGNNYSGIWLHPLNAYRLNQKNPEEEPLSIKGQPGGMTYRHWLGLAQKSENIIPARIVNQAQDPDKRKEVVKERGVNLWAAGYDMDNMKARCWYEATMPVYALDKNEVKIVQEYIGTYISAASDMAMNLKSTVKFAWFNRPKDNKGNLSFLDTSFWQNTETDFYHLLDRLVNNITDNSILAVISAEWEKIIIKATFSLFDSWALAQQEDGLNMKRVIKARNYLETSVKKDLTDLRQLKTVNE